MVQHQGGVETGRPGERPQAVQVFAQLESACRKGFSLAAFLEIWNAVAFRYPTLPMIPIFEQSIGQYFVGRGILAPDDVEEVRRRMARHNGRFPA